MVVLVTYPDMRFVGIYKDTRAALEYLQSISTDGSICGSHWNEEIHGSNFAFGDDCFELSNPYDWIFHIEGKNKRYIIK